MKDKTVSLLRSVPKDVQGIYLEVTANWKELNDVRDLMFSRR